VLKHVKISHTLVVSSSPSPDKDVSLSATERKTSMIILSSYLEKPIHIKEKKVL
jgi:hypothetical protein